MSKNVRSRPFVLSVRDGEFMNPDFEKVCSVLRDGRIGPRIMAVKIPSNHEAISHPGLRGQYKRKIAKHADPMVIIDTQLSGGSKAAADEAERFNRALPFSDRVYFTLSLGVFAEQVRAIRAKLDEDIARKVGLLLTGHLPETAAKTLEEMAQCPVENTRRLMGWGESDMAVDGIFAASGDLVSALEGEGSNDRRLMLVGAGVSLSGESYGEKIRAVSSFEECGRVGLKPVIGSQAFDLSEGEWQEYLDEAHARYLEGSLGRI